MTNAERQRKYVLSPKGQAYLKSEAHAESKRRYNRKRRRVRGAEIVRMVRALKIERGCLKCGYKAHFVALQFHHRDPKTKKFDISYSKNRSLKDMFNEMAKCDVLCSNCHAILEYEKRQDELKQSGSTTVVQQADYLKDVSSNLTPTTNMAL